MQIIKDEFPEWFQGKLHDLWQAWVFMALIDYREELQEYEAMAD